MIRFIVGFILGVFVARRAADLYTRLSAVAAVQDREEQQVYYHMDGWGNWAEAP